MGMPTVSVPIGDPQSNRKPRLSTSGEYFGQAVLRFYVGLIPSPKYVVGQRPVKEGAIVLLTGSPFSLISCHLQIVCLFKK